MKVVHVGYQHPYNDIRIARKQCTSLARAGYEVTYITSNKNGEQEEDIYQGVTIKVLKLRGKRFIRLFHYMKDVYKILLEEDAQIYHFHEFELSIIAKRLIKRHKIVFYDMHEDVPRNLRPKLQHIFGKALGRIFERWIEWYENSLIKKANCNFGVTPQQGIRVTNLGGKFELIRNYPLRTDIGKIKQSTKASNVLCFCGALAEERNTANLVKAMEKIDGELVLAGAVSDDYLMLLKNMPEWSKTTYMGLISKDEVDQIYVRSKVGLCIYPRKPNFINASANKLFEYMEAGIPIVCSNFPYWVEIVEKSNCGICVDPDNVEQIAEAAEYILKNSEEAERMAENGRLYAKTKYNWQAEEKKLLSVYQKISEE